MRFLKRLYIKMRLAYRKQYYTQQNQEKYERAPLFICMKLLKIEDSLLLIAPVSDDKYIYNERLGILVSLLGNRGTIVDRTYSYDINLSNVKHSLDNIYNKITKDFNKINETGQVYNGRPVGELN